MDELQIKLCDIQGRLFELSAEKKIPSAAFIKAFMISDVAKALDSRYNRMQWMGEEYLLDEVISTVDRVYLPLLALLHRRKQHKDSASGSGKNHETQLFDVSYNGPNCRN